MSLAVKDGVTWRYPRIVYFNDGGTWRNSQTISIKDGSTWRVICSYIGSMTVGVQSLNTIWGLWTNFGTGSITPATLTDGHAINIIYYDSANNESTFGMRDTNGSFGAINKTNYLKYVFVNGIEVATTDATFSGPTNVGGGADEVKWLWAGSDHWSLNGTTGQTVSVQLTPS